MSAGATGRRQLAPFAALSASVILTWTRVSR